MVRFELAAPSADFRLEAPPALAVGFDAAVSAVKAQANKDVTPSFAQQVVTPDEDYDYLAQVTVAAIPIAYTDNTAGGQTVTIG